MVTKIFVLILHMMAISANYELDKSLKIVFRCSNSSMGNALHVLYNRNGIVKYSVIHCLRLINSVQLCNRKIESIC